MHPKTFSSTNHFLLVGNGTYQNRGCEAIVRGTTEILRKEFGTQIPVKSGVYASDEGIRQQNVDEIDSGIISFPLTTTGPRLSRKWFAHQANRRLKTSFSPQTWGIKQYLDGAPIALQVGGDNYSLDYGRPTSFIELDRYLQSHGTPVVLWGASVGPFDGDPEFASQMFDHLRNLKAIFVRESESLAYLQKNNVTHNVHLVADPAFVMQPSAPPPSKIIDQIPNDSIGINLSPLIARYLSNDSASSNEAEWLQNCAKMLLSVARLNLPICLIPHVGSDCRENDDFIFLMSLYQMVKDQLKVPITILPLGLSAAELKWIIARCSVFVGARTHSTIAALSTCVPTLSIGYSMKAIGINYDIFDNLEHCIHVTDLNDEVLFTKIQSMLENRSDIIQHLNMRIPLIQAKAYSAGHLLNQIISNI